MGPRGGDAAAACPAAAATEAAEGAAADDRTSSSSSSSSSSVSGTAAGQQEQGQQSPSQPGPIQPPPVRRRKKKRRALFRLPKAAPRKSTLAGDLTRLESRAQEAQRQLDGLRERNAQLRRAASQLADEIHALDLVMGLSGGGGGGPPPASASALPPGTAAAAAAAGTAAAGTATAETSSGWRTDSMAAAAQTSSSSGVAANPAAESASATAGAGHLSGPAFMRTVLLAHTRQQAALRELRALLARPTEADGGDGAPAATALPPARSRPNILPLWQGGGRDESAFLLAVEGVVAVDREGSGGGSPSSSSSSSSLFRASSLGLLGDSPRSAADAIVRHVAARAAIPLGARPLDAILAIYRDMAHRAALVLRRLDMFEREEQQQQQQQGATRAAAAPAPAAAPLAPPPRPGFATDRSQAQRELEHFTIDVLAWAATMARHYPSELDELLARRIDGEVAGVVAAADDDDDPRPRSPPCLPPHDDDALEVRHARGAAATAAFEREQKEALLAALHMYRRNVAQPVKVWREAVLQLEGGGGGASAGGASAAAAAQGAGAAAGGDAASSSAAALEPLLKTVEECMTSCAVHRSIFSFRFYSIARPRQVVSAVADMFPFVLRPVLIAAALDVEDDDDGVGQQG
jgi:hypothetical protein